MPTLFPPHPSMPQDYTPSRDGVDFKYTRRTEDTALLGYLRIPDLDPIARLQKPAVPARTPVLLGRTVYLYVANDQKKPETRIKLKGAAGLTAQKDRITGENTIGVAAPAPDIPYNPNNPVMHLSFDHSAETPLSLTLVPEGPKAFLSLSLTGAEREYDCMERLAHRNLSHPPLFAAQRLRNGAPEIDVHSRPTGVTASLLPFTSRFVSDYLDFGIFASHEGGSVFIKWGCEEKPMSLGSTPSDVFKSLVNIFAKMAEAKSRAIVEAKVARHNGNPQNFILDKAGNALLADLDSALLLDQIAPNQWGAQMLRDFTKDLMRAIESITFLAGNPVFFRAIERGELPLVEPILTGFYGKFLPSEKIQHTAKKIQSAYISLVDENQPTIALIQAQHFLIRDTFGGAGYLLNQCHRNLCQLLAPLHADILAALYTLQRASDSLTKQHFHLPDLHLNETALRKHFEPGVDAYAASLSKY